MAGSTKCRRVCGRPAALRFMPDARAAEILDLSLEELESLRLCDLEGLDQETAARRMVAKSASDIWPFRICWPNSLFQPE